MATTGCATLVPTPTERPIFRIPTPRPLQRPVLAPTGTTARCMVHGCHAACPTCTPTFNGGTML
jgi:hypothetical protein